MYFVFLIYEAAIESMCQYEAIVNILGAKFELCFWNYFPFSKPLQNVFGDVQKAAYIVKLHLALIPMTGRALGHIFRASLDC